jgi:hypothetical protein
MKIAFLFFFCSILLSCSPGDSAKGIIEKAIDKIETTQVKKSSFDYGDAKSGTYKNDYFNFQIKFDTAWTVQNQTELNGLVEQGKKLIKDGGNLEKIIEASEINTAYLFAMFKYQVGAALSFNPSLMTIAENTKRMPAIKVGKDYLFHAKNNLQQTKLNYTFDENYTSKKLGNYNFDILTAHLNGYATPIIQEYFATVMDGFTLSFIISYSSKEEKRELYEVLESMRNL